jgi:hypothetical protein
MPSQRLIASNALMCLNGYRNGSSDSVGSDIYYTGEDLDQDIDIVLFVHDDGPQNYSTSTESRLSLNDTEDPDQEWLSSNDTLDLDPHQQTVVHQRKRSKKRNAKSGIWHFFEVYHDPKFQNLAFCLLCQQDVNYSKTMSTGILTRHVRKKHQCNYKAMLESEITKKFRANAESNVKLQWCIDKYAEFNSFFDAKLTRWIVQTYQPLSACENPFFREMCCSLNPKAPIIGAHKIKVLLLQESACVRVKLRSILKGVDVSVTTDAWTSWYNVTYITCTAHFVDPKTWLLHHFPLGLFNKSGTSLAENVVKTVKDVWLGYDIDYSNITCIVTDTEATMVKVARIFVSQAEHEALQVSWHGCIDHLLNLITKIAFKDFSEWSHECCKGIGRSLQFFLSSRRDSTQQSNSWLCRKVHSRCNYTMVVHLFDV